MKIPNDILEKYTPLVAHLKELGVADALFSDFSSQFPDAAAVNEIEDVVKYIATGNISKALAYGKCSHVIRSMGLESMFDEHPVLYTVDSMLYPKNDHYTKSLRMASESIWWQTMTNLYERQTVYVNPISATKATVRVMDAKSFSAEPLIVLKKDTDWTIIQEEEEDPRSRVTLSAVEEIIGCLNMPWLADEERRTINNGGGGVILAGGCMESMLLNNKPRDVDLFLVVPVKHDTDMEIAGKAVYIATFVAIVDTHKSLPDRQMFMKVSKHVTTITVRKTNNPFGPDGEIIVYQIIHRVYASAAQVVAGFDIDSCRLFFDGSDLRAHDTAFRAWRNGWNLFDANTLSTTAVIRYTKKYRAGLGILIVGMNDADIQMFKSKWSTVFGFSEEVLANHASAKAAFKCLMRDVYIGRRWGNNVPSLLMHTVMVPKFASYLVSYKGQQSSDYESSKGTTLSDKIMWFFEPIQSDLSHLFAKGRADRIAHGKWWNKLHRFSRRCFLKVVCGGGDGSIYNVLRHQNNTTDVTLDIEAGAQRHDKLFTGSFNPVKSNIYVTNPVVNPR
jgi:hypothetical protein